MIDQRVKPRQSLLMATFTQHKQPYGPLARRTYTVDGVSYDIVRGDLWPHGRKYYLRLTGIPGKPEANVFVLDTDDTEAMMLSAKRRLIS